MSEDIRLGFGYEQGAPGLYLYDASTGLVVCAEDVAENDAAVAERFDGAAVGPSNRWIDAFESAERPGWYTMECAPIGLQIDLTDGTVTCLRCRWQEGRWFGAEHISPTHWKLWEWPTSS